MNRVEVLLENTYFTDHFHVYGVEKDLPLKDEDFEIHQVGCFVFYKIKGTNWHVLPFDFYNYFDESTRFTVHMMCRGIIMDIEHDTNTENILHEIIKLTIPEVFELEKDFLMGNISAQLLLKNLNIRRGNELK